MKNVVIIPIFLLLILLLAYTCGSAQDFLVTTKSDTLYGELKPINYGAEKKVQITDKQKKKTIVSMFQTKSFSIKNEIYQPVKGPTGYSFMKLIKSGYLSLYAFQQPNQSTYDSYYILKKDGKGMEVPNLTFKKSMISFLEDCSEVTDKIERGDLGKRELIDIIDDYNICITTKSSIATLPVAEKKTDVDSKKLTEWNELEKLVSDASIENKSTALEMIQEIKSKISKGEKIPNFLISGLKSMLTQEPLKETLETALASLE